CTAEGIQLTPVATLQGEVAAANIFDRNGAEADYTGIPSAVFTIPVLASVGISEEKESDKYRVIFRDRSTWSNTRRAGMEFAASTIILNEKNDQMVGAHTLGPNAEEVIYIFAMAMRLGLRTSDI